MKQNGRVGEKKGCMPGRCPLRAFRFPLLLAAALFFAFCGKSADTAPKAAEQERPAVSRVGVVGQDIISITIEARRVEHGRQEPYRQEKGDRVVRGEEGNFWIVRGGKMIGALIYKEGKIMTFDRVVGEGPDGSLLDQPDGYSVSSPDDAAYASQESPQAVFRKSKPTDLACCIGATFDAPVEHTIYLKLAHPLKPGKRYAVKFPRLGLQEQKFAYDPAAVWSEAVHVSHIGFRPDDPSKIAFLSLWMGSGGGAKFREGAIFSVIDSKSNGVSFKGRVKLSKGAGDPTEDVYGKNYNGVDVYMMDFSTLSMPGTYRVCAEGIGCSHPFEIRDDVWRKAFYVSVRGLYHQRSGVEIGPPYTSFRRPRNFHPEDGVRVYASTARLVDTSNGLAPQSDVFTRLVQGRTAEIVPDAWGGYCDAGDWDRRIQHLSASRLLLELYGLFPDYFERLDLNIPGSKDLPDLIREALWDIDFYKRLQTKEGGVRGGIESEGGPRYGEASWQESQLVMAYAPDVWSTYEYAAAAAHAAYTLRTRNPALAQSYADSALSAMGWAERELPGETSIPDPVKDARNLAAAELFRMSGKKSWHDLFAATAPFKNQEALKSLSDQGEAAWVYALTDRPGVDRALKARCREAIVREAEKRLADQQKAGFRWMKDPWRPPLAGAFTVSDSTSVLRAHYLTGEKKYLAAAVLACQTGLGANPLNMCYTTGLGWKSPLHAMHFDSRVINQEPPPGITVHGPLDVQFTGGFDSPMHKTPGRFCYPDVTQWPVIETYWDVFWYPVMCEFTIHQTIGPNAYVWGYLAARKAG